MKQSSPVSIITGGGGFIGDPLTRQLAQSGPVIVIDHHQAADPQLDHLCADYDSTSAIKLLSRAHTIYHLAWRSTPASSHSLAIEEKTNIKPSQKFIKHAKQAGVKRFVFLSSAGAVYGNSPRPFIEIQTPQPLSSYGQAKLAVEETLKNLAEPEFQVTIFRATNVIHPSQKLKRHQGLIPAIAHAISTHKPFNLWGNSRKDYLSLEDLVTGIIKTKPQKSFEVVNLGSGTTFTSQQIINLAEEVVGHHIPLTHTLTKSYDTANVEVDLHKLHRLSDWLPQTDMSEYIKQVINTQLNHEQA